jgi:aerobic carbon-monoxide dehydrogenase medium subunit
MKPPVLLYHRPSTMDEALAVLASAGPGGKVLAGGQSLVPLLNMRLAAPERLIDINRLAELCYVRTAPDAVRVGALARHADTERDPAARAALPLLREATACVAHPAIRNRGTTVGSLVHADPAAELPAVLALLEGWVEVAGAGGRRAVPAAEFFLAPLTSAVRDGELATEAVFPRSGPRTGTAWLECSRRRGDYALAGAGVLVALDEDLRVTRARAAFSGVGPAPLVVEVTEAVAGRVFDAVDWAAAGALAAAAAHPEEDIHATAGYRRQLVRVLTARAGRLAAHRAAPR